MQKLRKKVHFNKLKKTKQRFLFPELNYEIMSKKQARNVINSLFEIMAQRLENGDHILISGFGKFQVKFRWARRGRNPKTGESIILNSRRVVTFRASPKLKEKMRK